MIPKIIHYCWFGGNPLPPLALRCIESWRKFLPDYEIKQWDESNFDVNIIPYTAEAYRQKKYAFVSDYARFWIMYKYGGIYFDTDVEVIKPLDDIIERGCFMGFEVDPDGVNTPGKFAPRYTFAVNPGIGWGISSQHPFVLQMLNLYQTLSFQIPSEDISWYKTIVAYTTEKLCEIGLKNQPGIQQLDDISVYPSEFFAPIKNISGRMHLTVNTRSIHRYMGSWGECNHRTFRDYIRHYLPEWVFYLNNRIKRQRFVVNSASR